MNSPARDALDYAVAQGLLTLGATSGWGGYAHIEPATPDTVATFYDTGSFGTADYDVNIYRPTINIRVRANDYNDAYDKAYALMNEFISVNEFTVNSQRYFRADVISEPSFIGRDDNDRNIVTINLNLMRQR